MNRVLARLATLAVAVPFAVASATAPAQATPVASVTVPGCWGGGGDSTIVCNLTVSIHRADVVPSVFYVRVCAGECYDIPVQNVTITSETDVCYSYTDGGGWPHSGCVNNDQWNFTLGPVIEALRCDPGQDAFCTYV